MRSNERDIDIFEPVPLLALLLRTCQDPSLLLLVTAPPTTLYEQQRGIQEKRAASQPQGFQYPSLPHLLYFSWSPYTAAPISTTPHKKRREAIDPYLGQIKTRDHNAMHRARSMLRHIAGIAARVVLVPVHTHQPATHLRRRRRTNLKSLPPSDSVPAFHGIESLGILMRVSSEVAEVGLRPVVSSGCINQPTCSTCEGGWRLN